MDDDIQLFDVPEGKVYKTGHLAAATFFGGVFVGAYLLAANFKTLGERRSAAITWVTSITLFIAAILAPLFIPALLSIPNIAYAALFALLATWAGRRFQLKKINQHIDMGGQMYSTNRVVAVTLIGFGITVSIALLLFFIQDNLMFRRY